jgi:predicted methyltransferase
MVRKSPLVACAILSVMITASAAVHAQTEQTREGWQRVGDLFAAAGVRAGARIADLGAGDGFLTVRLSPAVGPHGKVYAIDIDQKVTDGLRQRVADAHLTNVDVVVGTEDDPHLPIGELDGVIVLNAYHEMPKGVAVLRHIREALKPGGRLVLCEPLPRTPGQSRVAQIQDHVLDPALILEDLRAAGFQLVDRQDTFAMNWGGTRFGLVAARRLD